MKRYLFFWLAMTALLLLAVAAFNLVIDPYGLFRWIEKPGFNQVKPTAANRGPMMKAYQALRVRPRGLILGNSRSEVGFDPQYAAWPAHARPVLNLALPGTGTSTTLQYLQHTLASGEGDGNSAARPEVIVWGLDFMDFLVDASVPQRKATKGNATSRATSRLITNVDGSKNTGRWLPQAKDYAESTLTLTALFDSIQTLGNQENPYAVDLTALGFNPMHDYLKLTTDEGYWRIFNQKDQSNIQAYLRRPKTIFDIGGRSSPQLDDLRQILAVCRQNGVALHLVIYPYHAHLLEIIRIAGHWPAFEAWKRAVLDIVSEEAAAAAVAGGNSVALWDFSGFNALSGESVPAKDDRLTKMRWYWEAGHFKRELGNLIQERVLGHATTEPGFGILLSRSNVEQQIAAIRAQEIEYRRTHAQDINDLEKLFAAARLRKMR